MCWYTCFWKSNGSMSEVFFLDLWLVSCSFHCFQCWKWVFVKISVKFVYGKLYIQLLSINKMEEKYCLVLSFHNLSKTVSFWDVWHLKCGKRKTLTERHVWFKAYNTRIYYCFIPWKELKTSQVINSNFQQLEWEFS